MDQKRIGTFIAELRKESDMTQRELAEIVGVSDKTISKWECGNSMPDISYVPSIGEALGVSVNELLSGEKLSKEAYSSKAEENIMNLMKENEKSKKSNGVFTVLGILMIVVTLYLLLAFIEGYESALDSIGYFWDGAGMLLLFILTLGELLVARVEGTKNICHFIRKVAFPNGIFIFAVSVIEILRYISNPKTLGPNFCVAVLVLIYAAILYMVAYILETRFAQKGA